MRDLDVLRIDQLEETVKPFRKVLEVAAPEGGWIRAVREAAGFTNAQLARRLGRKAPQTVEDMQRNEALGTIQLNTLRALAEAMNCRVVYSVVPVKPLHELREDRARQIATKTVKRTSHSMKLESQGLRSKEEKRAVDREVRRLLAGNPRRLWDQ